MHVIRRYIRLYGQFFVYSFRREMEYKTNFISTLLVELLFYLVTWFLFEIIYSHVDSIGAYTVADMRVFLATVYLTDCTWMLLFERSTQKINQYATQGDLDFLILRPVNSQFLVSCRFISLPHILNIIVLSSAVVWLVHQHNYVIHPLRAFLYALLCLNGALLIYVIDISLACLVFWFRNFSNARWLWFEILKFSHRPDSIYPRALRMIFLFVPPISLINTLPTDVLIKHETFTKALYSFGVTAVLLFMTSLIWNAGLRRYESASS